MPRRQPESQTARKKHGKRTLTDAQRAELSRRAKAMHASGKLDAKRDGAKGGLAKRANATITGAISEAAMRDKAAIVRALKAGVREGSAAQRTKAAEAWARLADLETQRQQRQTESDQKVKAQRSRDEMLAELSRSLTTGPVAQLLRQQLAVESTAEPITDAELVEPGLANR